MESLELRNVACLALWAWLLVDMLLVFSKYSRRAKRADRGSLGWLVVMLWAGIAAAIALSFRSFGSFGNAAVSLQFLGLAVMVLGIFMRSLAIYQLGKLHMPVVAIQADHPLMDRGLYSRVRHPSYLGAIMALTGFGLALGNWLSTLVVFLAALLAYGYRIHVEEKALVAGLGERYVDYRRRTQRLIPWIY